MADQTVTIELNPEEKRLYERIRSAVVSSRPKREPSGLLDLLFLLPDFTVLLMRLLRDDRVPIMAKAIALGGVAYVVSPIDVMPGLLLGPVGLVDDLVIVAACVSSMLNRVHPDVVRSHWSGQGDVLDALASVTDLVEDQLIGSVRSTLGRLMGGRPAR
ncbi:MAG: DUF1232 domain-containing protein [Actinomycetota bacterium]|nr:DUF1232 domain-containing protein [Actinomycetota bacterium]